jgi:hypothetical protein
VSSDPHTYTGTHPAVIDGHDVAPGETVPAPDLSNPETQRLVDDGVLLSQNQTEPTPEPDPVADEGEEEDTNA